MIWPDFCSALIVRRLAPLGLHNTRFPPLPVSCSPRTGAAGSTLPPRDPSERRQFQVPQIPEGLASPDELGPARAVGAPGHGVAIRVADRAGRGKHAEFSRPRWRTRDRCTAAPWPERCTRPSAPPCEAAHDTACSSARSGASASNPRSTRSGPPPVPSPVWRRRARAAHVADCRFPHDVHHPAATDLGRIPAPRQRLGVRLAVPVHDRGVRLVAPTAQRLRRAPPGSLATCSTVLASDGYEPRDSVSSLTAFALNSGVYLVPFAMVPSSPIELGEMRN